MQNAIKQEIKRLARRALEREALQEAAKLKFGERFEKRTGIQAKPSAPYPARPKPNGFDPKNCARNANFLAKTIWHKVRQGTYEPKPAISYKIPKPDGSFRTVMAFAIPDAALANVVIRRATDRNLKRLSPSSYAYHPSKNLFDAILALQSFDHTSKLFAVQIDFEKYFDTIPTRYLKGKIDDADQIGLTPDERFIFHRFMRHQHANLKDYNQGRFKRRFQGVPQGSSVSLLLANLANHDLDVKLSAEAGQFARYADDVVALCTDYAQAQRIEERFYDHCRSSGLKINTRKSPGIAVISERSQELKTSDHFDFLGYRFLEDGLSIPKGSIARYKTRFSRLTHLYLIHYLRWGFRSSRSSTKPVYDWDLLGLIYELRRSLYGGLTEQDLSAFIQGGKRLKKVGGTMGFFCLISDPTALKEFDGWLLNMVRRATRIRKTILNDKYNTSCPTPSNKALATGTWLDSSVWRGEGQPDARLPSMVRGWRAARKHFFSYGLEGVQPPSYYGADTGFAELLAALNDLGPGELSMFDRIEQQIHSR